MKLRFAALMLIIASLATGTASAMSGGEMPEILNARQPSPGLLTGGQPERDELRAASDAGVETVVNLRGEGEFTEWDEAALAEELGMRYVHIPVSSAEDLNAEAVSTLDQALSDSGDSATLVHCASGNRVGALFALRAAFLNDHSDEEAMRIGREHGLTSLESVVREILNSGRLPGAQE